MDYRQDMERFLDSHLQDDMELEPWLLGDLAHVQHHTHLPWQLPAGFFDYGSSSDDDIEPHAPSPTQLPRGMHVSTFYRNVDMPRVHVSFPGHGPVPPPRFPGHEHTLSPPPNRHQRWLHSLATVDMGASRCFMSLSFLNQLGYDASSLNAHDSGEISELNVRPGGWHELSHRDHRSRYWGLGTIDLMVSIARAGQLERPVLTTFEVLRFHSAQWILLGLRPSCTIRPETAYMAQRGGTH